MYFTDLPIEITYQIITYLDIEDIKCLSQCHRQYRYIINDESFWKKIIYRDFNISKEKELSKHKNVISYYHQYKLIQKTFDLIKNGIPLHECLNIAVNDYDLISIKLLLSKRKDIDWTEESQVNRIQGCFDKAIKLSDNEEIVDMFKNVFMDDVNEYYIGISPNVKIIKGRQLGLNHVLITSLLCNNSELAKYCLDHGANQYDGGLIVSIRNGNVEMFNIFLNLFKNIKCYSYLRAIYECLTHGRKEFYDQILYQCDDKNIINRNKNILLLGAAIGKDIDFIKKYHVTFTNMNKYNSYNDEVYNNCILPGFILGGHIDLIDKYGSIEPSPNDNIVKCLSFSTKFPLDRQFVIIGNILKYSPNFHSKLMLILLSATHGNNISLVKKIILEYRRHLDLENYIMFISILARTRQNNLFMEFFNRIKEYIPTKPNLTLSRNAAVNDNRYIIKILNDYNMLNKEELIKSAIKYNRLDLLLWLQEYFNVSINNLSLLNSLKKGLWNKIRPCKIILEMD